MDNIGMLERYGEDLTDKEYVTDPAIGDTNTFNTREKCIISW